MRHASIYLRSARMKRTYHPAPFLWQDFRGEDKSRWSWLQPKIDQSGYVFNWNQQAAACGMEVVIRYRVNLDNFSYSKSIQPQFLKLGWSSTHPKRTRDGE